jgi:predicted nucleic acid-binding protein
MKPDRPPQPKHTIAEGQLQIQPLAQSQAVVQLLKKTLGQGEAGAMDSADWL